MVSHPVIIIGGSGHTRSLIGVLKKLEWPIRGIITSNETLLGTEVHGVPVLGREGDVPLSLNEIVIINGVGNNPTSKGTMLAGRISVFRRYHDQGYFINSVVSHQAILQPDIMVGHGVQVMPGAIIQPGAMIGENAIINTRAVIEHDCVIAPHVHVAPGAVICGTASIGEGTHIGAGAVVLQRVTIGANVVIGAGVTVTRDVADGAVVKS